MYSLFQDITEKNKTNAIFELISDSTPKPSFYFLVILSVLMSTFGLILNNASVIIGSMLIAPILSPLLSLSLGITVSDPQLMKRSTFTLLKSVGWSILVAILATLLMWSVVGNPDFQTLYNSEILSRTETTIYFTLSLLLSQGLQRHLHG